MVFWLFFFLLNFWLLLFICLFDGWRLLIGAFFTTGIALLQDTLDYALAFGGSSPCGVHAAWVIQGFTLAFLALRVLVERLVFLAVAPLTHALVTEKPLAVKDRLRLLVERLYMISKNKLGKPLPYLLAPDESIIEILLTHKSLKIFKVETPRIKLLLFGFKAKAIVCFRWE